MIITFVLVWNLLIGGILIHQMLKDNVPAVIVAQTVVVTSAFVIVATVFLLKNSRRPPSEGSKP